MAHRTRSFLRHLILNAAIFAAFFVGVAATHLAVAFAFLWAGPPGALAVYFIVIVAFVSTVTYRITE